VKKEKIWVSQKSEERFNQSFFKKIKKQKEKQKKKKISFRAV